MKIVQHGKKRKAISPVLATVILIAITLIAAIAVAGFVFGLFGSFTSSATVTAQVTSCLSANPGVCTVVLTNTGTSNVAETGCSVQIAGSAVTGLVADVAPTTTPTIPASGSSTYTCTSIGAAQTVGSMAVGHFSLANGASVPFSGTWQ